MTAASRLQSQVQNAGAKRRREALLLVAPLLAFLLLGFALPVVSMLSRSVWDTEASAVLPRTAAAVRSWNATGLPPDTVVIALALDLVEASRDKTIGKAARRLNAARPGFRSLIMSTGRSLGGDTIVNDPHPLERLKTIDPRWGDEATWAVIRQAVRPFTTWHFLRALDLSLDSNDEIVRVPAEQAVHLQALGRTVWISGIVTLLCLGIGYPLAFFIAGLTPRQRSLVLMLVLLPFWTSLLVRTAAWLVLLQTNGLVNDFLLWIGVLSEPAALVHNRLGVYLAMVHVLLPMMVLPLVGVMTSVDPTHMKAALSLGASPLRSFLRVYAPQTMPGVVAGTLICFIMSLGYYITPALVGGPKDQMLSYFVAFNVNMTLDWSLAAALSLILIVCVAVLLGLAAYILKRNAQPMGLAP